MVGGGWWGGGREKSMTADVKLVHSPVQAGVDGTGPPSGRSAGSTSEIGHGSVAY